MTLCLFLDFIGEQTKFTCNQGKWSKIKCIHVFLLRASAIICLFKTFFVLSLCSVTCFVPSTVQTATVSLNIFEWLKFSKKLVGPLAIPVDACVLVWQFENIVVKKQFSLIVVQVAPLDTVEFKYCWWSCLYLHVCLFFIFSQTKSCSSFPEWLRLSFRPVRIFCAGEVSLCSGGSVLDVWLCPTLCLLLEWFVFRSARRPTDTTAADPCAGLDEVTLAVDVGKDVESSPSMYCTTCRGLTAVSPLLSVVALVWWVWQPLSLWGSKFCEGICAPGSGEELRLLSALPGWPFAAAPWCLAARDGLGNRYPGLWCRWYFTGCLVKR